MPQPKTDRGELDGDETMVGRFSYRVAIAQWCLIRSKKRSAMIPYRYRIGTEATGRVGAAPG